MIKIKYKSVQSEIVIGSINIFVQLEEVEQEIEQEVEQLEEVEQVVIKLTTVK